VPPYRRRPATGRRPAGAAALLALLALAGTGCASFDATFGQQEAVVAFQPGTPAAVRLRVRAACSHLPSVKAEPVPSRPGAGAMPGGIRYQVTGASDGDLARLQRCLQRFPSVTGIDFSGPAGS
jgi:hypothetical protein